MLENALAVFRATCFTGSYGPWWPLREEYRGETVGILDGLGRRHRLLLLFVAKAAGIENVGAHPEFLGGFLGDD
jgi:hypothetical protein